ncbi:MAG: L,D-transpeptidase [Polyangiaceae bacterium]|nr:L,D-transpeptidase [Polyangiaceae bacterium]
MLTPRRILALSILVFPACDAKAPPSPAVSLSHEDTAKDAPRDSSERVSPSGAANVKRIASTDAPGATPARVSGPKSIGAIAERAYIYKKPQAKGLPLGYIRMGTSAPLLSNDPVEGKDCPRGYYKVKPRGYVCLDPRKTTLDLSDPYYQALAQFAPAKGTSFPYSYAFSNGAPMYSRVPTAAEAEKAERSFGEAGKFVQLAEWSAGHEELIANGEKIVGKDAVPAIFADHKRTVGGNGAYDPKKLVWRVIPNGSMVAYAKAFEQDGRVWLVTPDLMLVPADRMRPFRRSKFHGVHIGEKVNLPLAWNRGLSPIQKFTKDDDKMIPMGETIASKTFVQINDEPIKVGKQSYYPLRNEPGVYIAATKSVTVTRLPKKLPTGVGPGEKWIEAKINPGTLTAYEGMTPVYATMFSPGKGGAPVPGYDPYVHSMTKTGFFPIEWKDHVSVMSPDKEWPPKKLWISEVPHIQYLRAPLAMHVAYWHEDFGNLKSAECVNLSPEDGAFMFGWTDPPLPEGWGGIRPGDGNGKSTPVVITAF